ncbi:MAG: gamma-glutamyl-gamma-aminobutyrate hydrolase family protein [Bacteroidetes bacterium]|nr:gamma-glutamyl-gamma-aminobutyrate hydrolase family protein [Bacteroidota bacterium]
MRRLYLFLVAIIMVSCTSNGKKPHELTIAISKERKNEKKYSDWLARQQVSFQFIDMSLLSVQDALSALDRCDALVLTGGNDIYPEIYGKGNDSLRCGEFDRTRDSLEQALFTKASSEAMPILGICRGLQMINVCVSGSLYIDLPEDKGSGQIHRQGEEGWTMHQLAIEPNTLLSSLVANNTAWVASNHHQGIDSTGSSLKALAICPDDSLIEAIGWKQPENKGFLLGVQWHPEWMDANDTFSAAVAKTFLAEAQKFHQNR